MTLLPPFNASQSSEAFLDFDFSNSLNFTNTTVGNFSCPFPPSPPPDEGGRPISGHLGMLNIELLHTLSRWSLEKIEQVYKKQQNALLKAMIEGLSSKLSKAFDQLCIKSYASKSQFVIPQQWIVFPLFGASSMSFQPINNAPDFQFNLSPPDSEDKRTLTIQWGQRTITFQAPLIDDQKNPLFYKSGHSSMGAGGEKLVPLALNSEVTAYVIPPDATAALAQEILGYIQLEQELDHWINAENVSDQEKQSRIEVKKRIEYCINHSSNILNLGNLFLTSLPESFGNLRALQSLDLSQNQLTTLPESFGNLKALEKLYLNLNQLITLPESFGNLRALKRLELASNRLTTLPESFGNLRVLETLHLNHNLLTTLPESFGNLGALIEFYLIGNLLTALPENFGNLRDLVVLYLSTNQLTSLPESFGRLRALERLYLHRNPFRSLPQSILSLPSSLIISLDGHNLSERTLNNLRTLLQEYVDRGERVPRFLFSMPPPRSSMDLQPVQTSLEILMDLVPSDSLPAFNTALFETDNHPARLWLHNLLQTSDFTEGSIELQKKLAEVVLKAFKYAAEHQDFQELFSLFLDTANVSCVDRITLSLIELEILIELKMRSGKPDPRAAQLLLKNVWAMHLLHEFAHEVVLQMPLVDELDVHLAFLIHCKAPLKKLGIDLPFSSEKMHFFGITGLRPEHLDRAVRRVKEQVNSGHASEQLIEFLFLEHNVIAKFSMDLFEKIFAKETEQIKKDKEGMLEKVEHFIAKKHSEAFDPKEVEESNLPQSIKSLFLQESLPDADVMKLYQEITRWQKMQYAHLVQNFSRESGV